jgi:hypothetical protein
LKTDERIVDVCHTVSLAYITVCTISDNVDRITESAKSENKVFVLQVYHSSIGMNRTKNYGCESLIFLLH